MEPLFITSLLHIVPGARLPSLQNMLPTGSPVLLFIPFCKRGLKPLYNPHSTGLVRTRRAVNLLHPPDGR
jgi:hypothetical protein